MKRSSVFILLLVLSLVLSACTAAAIGATTQPGNGANAGSDGSLSTQMQLAVGTLLLDETEQPISAETAGELLPLWKAVRSLGSSSTTTTQEYQALFEQIQETLPADQMDAITAMQLTRDDLTTLSEKLGINVMQGPGPMGTVSPEMLETLQAARESGQMPEIPAGGGGMSAGGGGMPSGGPPSGGFQGGGGGMPAGGGDPNMFGGAGMLTQDASTGGTTTRGGVMQSVPTALLDAVIEALQAKVEG